MSKFWLPLCISLISLIFLRMPKEAKGLTSIFNPTNSFGSSSKLETFLNVLIGLMILLLFLIVIKMDITIDI